MRLCCALFLSLFTLVSPALASGKKTSPKPLSASQLTQAYALLWDVASKQQNVDQVLIVKTARADVGGEVKKIAAYYERLVEKIEPLKVGATALPDLKAGLPPAEEQARQAIETENARRLLTASGAPFDLALLGTQAQALLYTRSLLAVIERNSSDSKNRAMFKSFQTEADALLQDIYALQEKLVAK